jgi:fucose permease
MLLLYVGAEATYAGWIYTYAIEANILPPETAGVLVSVFWGMIALGRLAVVPLAFVVKPKIILPVAFGGSLISALAMLTLPGAPVLWVGTFALGLAMAPVFPTVIAFAERTIALSGYVTSFFLIGAGIGAIVAPWIVGQTFEAVGPSVLMLAVAVIMAAEFVIYLMLMREVAGRTTVARPAEKVPA